MTKKEIRYKINSIFKRTASFGILLPRVKQFYLKSSVLLNACISLVYHAGMVPDAYRNSIRDYFYILHNILHNLPL